MFNSFIVRISTIYQSSSTDNKRIATISHALNHAGVYRKE